jgi:tetratricopeptide (TPR) repeat protein
VVVAAAALPFLTGFGDTPESRNRRGNRLYRQEQYDDALTEYRSAQVLAPELLELSFNAGNALYRKGVVSDAIREYAKAAGSPDSLLAADAAYNAGTASLNAGDLPTAIDLLKTSLKLDPADADAKHNLELARRLLEEQQQQQDQQEQDQQQQDQQQQDQEQQDQEQQDQEQEQQDQQDQQEQDQQEQDQEQQDQEQDQQQEQGQDQEQETPQQDQQQAQQDQQQGEGQQDELAMSPEEAARLLDAIDEAEGELQAELRAAKARKRAKVDKDW